MKRLKKNKLMIFRYIFILTPVCSYFGLLINTSIKIPIWNYIGDIFS